MSELHFVIIQYHLYVLITSKNRIYFRTVFILLILILSEWKFRNYLNSNTLLGVCISCYTDMLLYDMHQQHVSFKNEKNPRLCSAVVSYFSLSLSLSLSLSRLQSIFVCDCCEYVSVCQYSICIQLLPHVFGKVMCWVLCRFTLERTI